jgi:hypothetical protein
VTIEFRAMISAGWLPPILQPAPVRAPDKNNDRIRPLREELSSISLKWAGDSTPPPVDCGAVLQTRPIQPRPGASHLKTPLIFVFLASAAASIALHFSASLKGTDFPHFYCAGRMLLDGRGRQLYETAVQYRYQAQYAGRIGTLYNHPPFEALLYSGVAWLPLRYAYVLWSILNVLFLGIAARALAQAALPAWDWQMLTIPALTFVPLLLCLIQGQDSMVQLLIVTLAYADLRRQRDFSAGCWLGLGLFKFELVLPLVVVLLVARGATRKHALASGFAIVALALMGASAAISGWSVFIAYPKFLMHLPTQHFAGIIPEVMANFRGLVYSLFRDDQSLSAIAMLAVLSAVAMIVAINSWKHVDLMPTRHNRFDLAFSTTVLFALLVSYHLNPHDLTLLLLPIALTLYGMLANRKTASNESNSPVSNWTSTDWATLTMLVILFLPPLHLLALKAHLYALISIPLIMLFVSIGFSLRHNSCDAPAHR